MLNRFILIYSGFLFVIGCLSCKSDSVAYDMFKKKAGMALHELKNKQNPDGSWDAFFSFDTTPTKLKKEQNSWNNLIIVDLLKPLSPFYEFDHLLIKPMILIRNKFFDSNTGLVKFGTRIKEYPEDSDDTALFWIIYENKDTSLIAQVVDTLLTYRRKDGFYHIWLRKNGCENLRACGRVPNPVDLLSNMHVYMFLKKYAPVYAEELCDVFREKANRLGDLWVYNSKCPWLYYIRQIDLAKSGCSINRGEYDNNVKPVAGQKLYTEASMLIRDMNLGHNLLISEKRAFDILHKLSKDEFEFIDKNPLLMFHNDQSLKKPAYFWSYDLPYALWLRLYHGYVQIQKKSQLLGQLK